MIDTGRGLPIVMIPGIQGRWQWMKPAIDALSQTHRVLTFSLSDAGPSNDWFDAWSAHIDRLLDDAGLPSAALVGVSFGGLVAARYASSHPARVRALVLVSTPAPNWRIDAQRAVYLEKPVLSAPAFAIGAVRRLLPEVLAAQPTAGGRIRCLGGHLWRVLRYPASPTLMAAWVHTWQAHTTDAVWSEIRVPTLVVTGEADLDHVVPTSSTAGYLDLIPGARRAVLSRTGHIGLVSRPKEFAAVVNAFVDDPLLTL